MLNNSKNCNRETDKRRKLTETDRWSVIFTVNVQLIFVVLNVAFSVAAATAVAGATLLVLVSAVA